MKKNDGYQKLKKEVLGCYDVFSDFFTKAQIPQEGDSFDELKNQAKKIKADQFKLMVAGEAKSGKSTFINAYLGQEILPMDVLQCSSSVVEIKYGKKLALKAFYANGNTKCIEGKKAIQEFLYEHAALDDDYRDIPVNTINNELILKYKDKSIAQKIIDDLIKGVEKENIHHLSSRTYAMRIKEYIKTMQKQWGKIVTSMIITYPFEEESMRGISVIDSPGVNAAGRVGDVTAKYLEDADAIMFLRPITGVAVEASSFKDFLESKSVDRNQNAMFLVLTRATAESSANIQRACDEFVKMFGAQTQENRHGISRDQIIPVDSKAELYLNKFQTMTTKEILAEMKELAQKGEIENFLKAAKADAFEEDDLGNIKFSKELFLQTLGKQSNFGAIDQALNVFGRKAQYLALADFVQRMSRVYEKYEADIKDQTELYQEKVKNPKMFSERIDKLQNELIDIENRITKGLKKIENEYMASKSRGGKIEKDADEVVQKYQKEVANINGKSSYSLERLEKLSFRQVDIFRDYQNRLKNELLQECNQELRVIMQSGPLAVASLQPDFTPASLAKIKEQLKEKATEREWVDGGCFSSGHWRSRFSDAKFYDSVKAYIMPKIEKIRNDAVKEMHLFATGVIASYKEQLRKNIASKTAELDAIEKDQRENDEIIKLVQGKEQLLTQIDKNKNTLQDYGVMIDDVLKSSQNQVKGE